MRQKTGDFEKDVQSGYYNDLSAGVETVEAISDRNPLVNAKKVYQEQVRCATQVKSSEFNEDFDQFLLDSGIPVQYIQQVRRAAYERGHAYGFNSVLEASNSFIEIFK